MRGIHGIEDLGLFRVIGQPNLNLTVDRETGRALSDQCGRRAGCDPNRGGRQRVQPGLQGEQRYDLVMRYLPHYRDYQGGHREYPLAGSPSGERVSLAQLCKVTVTDGASEIYREGNQRYVAIKYSVRGRDLGSTVEEAIQKVRQQVKLPSRLPHRLGGRVREPEAISTAAR